MAPWLVRKEPLERFTDYRIIVLALLLIGFRCFFIPQQKRRAWVEQKEIKEPAEHNRILLFSKGNKQLDSLSKTNPGAENAGCIFPGAV